MGNDDTTIPVVFVFDKGYAPYAAVAIFSVLMHARHRCRIYCVVLGDALAEAQAIQARMAMFAAEIVLVPVAQAAFFRWRTVDYVSPATYGKLAIPELIDERRVIYLDCDLVVTCDVLTLLRQDMGPHPLAGCIDRIGGQSSAIPRAPTDHYLNAGVLLMDLDALRREQFTERATHLYERWATQATWHDQCLINKTLEGRKAVLTPNWNVMGHAVQQGRAQAAIERYLGKGIIHFSGNFKPWMRWSDTWLADIWSFYARCVWPPAVPMVMEPTTVAQQEAWAAILEVEGKFQQAARLRGQINATLAAHINRLA